MTAGYIGEETKRTENAGIKALIESGRSWPVDQRAWLAAALGIGVSG
jgi:hypothetical protein